MNGLLKVICLFVVISLGTLGLSTGSARAAMPNVDYLETFGIGAGMGGPGAIDLDDNGNLFVADRTAGVVKFSKLGTVEGQFQGVKASGTGLAVSPDGGKLFVAVDADGDFQSEQVAILDGASGALLGSLGQGGGEFANAGEIDLDSNGLIYVLDSSARVVRIFDGAGAAAGSFSVEVAGQLCALSAMAVNPATDEVFVADTAAPGAVRVYNATGTLLATYAAASDFGSAMVSFRGIAFDGQGRGYFIDNVSAKIAVLDFAGITAPAKAAVMGAIDLGVLAQGATQPQDAVVDSLSRLFVSGSYADGPSVAVLGVGNYQVPAANNAPGAPSVVAPMNGTVVASAQPTLQFGAASDADNDPLTYDVTVACAGQTIDSATGLAVLNYQVANALPENGQCTWSVKAFDGTDYSAEVSASFYVNAVNEAPAAPTLQSPLDQDNALGDTALVWSGSVDPDPNDTVSYLLTVLDASGNLVAEEAAVSGVTLSQTTAYASLVPGASYSWSVAAVDSTGLEAASVANAFVFAESGLVIDSNVPGADVYVGGNPGYLGTKVGQTPYVMLGAADGDYQVAVVHKGFEPVFGMVSVQAGGSAHFFADLLPALDPVGHFLRKGGLAAESGSGYSDIKVGGTPMPWLADIDSDGLLDLVVGKAGPKVVYFPGLQVVEPGGKLRFGARQVLADLGQREVAPCVVDWNNDGLQDLVFGAEDGLVRLVLNVGTANQPAFDAAGAVALQADGIMISAGGHSAPVVSDWNGDGLKDLLVGGDSGRVDLYLNVGTDDAPVLQAAGILFVSLKPKRVVPFVADWDADGDLDLMLSKNGKVFVQTNEAGVLAAPSRVAVLAPDRKKAALVQAGCGLFVMDSDNRKGKDFLAADSKGVLMQVKARASEPVAAFFDVLIQKLDQIADMVSSDPTLLAMVDQARGAAGNGDVDGVATSVDSLRTAQGLPTSAAIVCDELIGMMP